MEVTIDIDGPTCRGVELEGRPLIGYREGWLWRGISSSSFFQGATGSNMTHRVRNWGEALFLALRDHRWAFLSIEQFHLS